MKKTMLMVAILTLMIAVASCVNRGPYSGTSFSASLASGNAPLEVTFSGNSGTFDCNGYFELNYGDGQREQVTTNACREIFTRTHTYETAGTYTARLYGPISDSCDASGLCTMGQSILGTVAITVAPGQKADNTGFPPDSTLQGKTIIHTRAGDLALSYAGGNATLAGTLRRATPCVDWQITATVMESYPEQVIFDVHDASTAQVCIQVLGEPQHVSAAVQVSGKAAFTVLFEEEEVFRGTLS